VGGGQGAHGLGIAVALLIVEDVDCHRVGRPPAQSVVQIGRAPDQALPSVGKHLGFVHHHALESHVGQQVGVARVHHRHPLELFQALLQGFEVARSLGFFGVVEGGRGLGGNGSRYQNQPSRCWRQ
jgi:hypothetical protein